MSISIATDQCLVAATFLVNLQTVDVSYILRHDQFIVLFHYG